MLIRTGRNSRAARAAALLATVAAAAVAPSQAHASAPATDLAKAAFEQSFLKETIDHHYMGVKMGRVCMDRSRSRRLGDICTAIVVSQSEELARMRDQFLLGWYGVEKHPALMPADRADLAELRKLRGRKFDVRLSRMFIEHHRMQIDRSKTCLSSAEHHELIHTCMDQIDTQSDEIKQFRRVLRSYS